MTTSVHTSTHVFIPYANPYMRCVGCGKWVEGWHDPSQCGCDAVAANVPCCCRLGVEDVCPSWSPVDGCTCKPDAHDRPSLMDLTREQYQAFPGSTDRIPSAIRDLINRTRRGEW